MLEFLVFGFCESYCCYQFLVASFCAYKLFCDSTFLFWGELSKSEFALVHL